MQKVFKRAVTAVEALNLSKVSREKDSDESDPILSYPENP